MNILLLGSGGREHALAWKLKQSNRCKRLLVAPGNAGTAAIAENQSFGTNDFDRINQCCHQQGIDLVVVGPEEPLVKGLVDYLKKEGPAGMKIIGPSQAAAQLEGSKAFAKKFMLQHGIPTAAYREFTEENFTEGIEYIKKHPMPVVLKADGLAAGKGVLICQNAVEAVAEFELMIQNAKFGEAGKRVVVEEFLEGIELSAFVLTDGQDYVMLPQAKDYKRIGEGDQGLNTGGMGAISPVPFADAAFMKKIEDRVIRPTIEGLQKDQLDYCGFIFFGLISVGGNPFVIEYNCRLGDPETEVILPRIKTDLVDMLEAAASGNLGSIEVETDSRYAATVVAVSGGYPGDIEKGKTISGYQQAGSRDSFLFHMGTAERDGNVVTSGGRVLCATSLASDLASAVAKSLHTISEISFEGKYYRRDIGYEFLQDDE